MKTLFSFLKPYRKECVLAPLFKLLEALLELFVPLLMAAIIDKGIMASDSDYVLRTGLILVGLGLLGFGASATAQYCPRGYRLLRRCQVLSVRPYPALCLR